MRLTIVGRNPRAGGSECIIFGHFNRTDHHFTPVSLESRGRAARGEELFAHGEWDVRPMRPGSDLATAPALVGSATPGDYCHTTGRLVLVSHNWSGVLQINTIGRKYTIDLYSPETRLVLLDVVHEIVADLTPLAVTENGVLVLPALPAPALVGRIVEDDLWFRFLDCDADFNPGLLRRAIEFFRRPQGDELRLRLMAAFLPKLVRRAPPASAPPPDEQPTRLHDEWRLLAAAVEGLALRARA